MLASLIVLGAVLNAQNGQFPKPDLATPAVLRDSTIFKYLSEDDKKLDWKPFSVGRDWSGLEVPAIKSDATNLKVLLTVAERDFSNPLFSNTLEMRDKTRLLEAVSRLKSLFAVTSGGSLNLQIIPRFIPEPIYDIREFKDLVDTEFNKSKFEADDTVERGPFAAIIALSSSHVSLPDDPSALYKITAFADLDGSGADMRFEERLYGLIQDSVLRRLTSHYSGFGEVQKVQNGSTLLYDNVVFTDPTYYKLFDPAFRQDLDLITKWAETDHRAQGRAFLDSPKSAVLSPASVATQEAGVLTYSELAILRAGEFILPASAKWANQTAVKFDVRTRSYNPMAVKFWMNNGSSQEVVLGPEQGMVPVTPDFTWQSISVAVPKGVVGATIGVPSAFFGRTRVKAELMQMDFRNFDLVTESVPVRAGAPAVPPLNTEEAFRQVLTTGNRIARRQAMQQLDTIKLFKGLEPILLSQAADLDAGVSHDATKAYFEVSLSGTPTPEEIAALTKFISAPPNEAAREAALSYVTKNPSFATFAIVSACSVRESWRTRLQAISGLGALYRANVREKEACKQLLLMSTAQELGLIRRASLELLDPAAPKEAERLESTMVNDPCEAVRLACLRILAGASGVSKDKLFGSLADDSPTLRESVPNVLGSSSPYFREALQKMVVDQDPYVRVAALRHFATLGDVKEGEIQNVFTDKHPAVQIAVLQGAKKKAWTIPGDALGRFKASSIRSVRDLAAEIQ